MALIYHRRSVRRSHESTGVPAEPDVFAAHRKSVAMRAPLQACA